MAKEVFTEADFASYQGAKAELGTILQSQQNKQACSELPGC
jgi:hypothetical protein